MTYALNDKDRYGFYTVGDRKTYSKLEAIDYSKLSGQAIQWHYNQDVYGTFDWTAEPTQSLDKLYEARARQIREQYDYLVLWYSGGADSHNILMSFVRAGIYIDEIAQYHQLTAHRGDKTTSNNREVFETSAPLTQQLINSNPIYATTKHRLVDMTDYQTTLLLEEDTRWDFFYKVNQYYSPNALSRYNFRQRIDDYKKLISAGKKLCFIYGVEKPIVTQTNQGYYINFRDGQDHGVSAWAQKLNRPEEYDEFFYWAPDMPEIPCKQAHVIRKYIEGVTPAIADGVHLTQGVPYTDEYGTHQADPYLTGPFINFVNRGFRYYLSMRGVNRLLYPDWDANAVVQGKPHGHMFPPRDLWMHDGSAPDMGQRYYQKGIVWMRNHVRSIDPDLWWEFKFDRSKAPYIGGIKTFFNSYYIGPIQND